MRKPRVLLIENSRAVTGALVSAVRSSSQLSHRFHIEFVLPSGSKASSYVQQHGLMVHHLPMVELQKSAPSLLAYIPMLIANTVRLGKLIKSKQIDLLVVNDFYNLLPATYRFFGGKVPLLCYVRFLPSKFPSGLVRIWCRWQYRHSYGIVAVSQAVKSELKPDEKIVVIGNELPVEETPYTLANSKTILYMANFIAGKGQQYALGSFARLVRDFPDWTLRFVGGDMGLQKNKVFKTMLMTEAKVLGVEKNIEWSDFESDPKAEFLSCRFSLNFSDSESFSMTILESMFYGRPVIATRSGGPQEIVDDGITGLLVQAGDVNEMESAMRKIMDPAFALDRMSAAAFESVRRKFDRSNTVDRLGNLYQAALDAKLNSNNR
ncbi:MAG: glycosyltransferase family 4 protein [Bacteroidia bacterium]|nr:glycosyltransferase family 4 protein [Bacteroidia bacterium]